MLHLSYPSNSFKIGSRLCIHVYTHPGAIDCGEYLPVGIHAGWYIMALRSDWGRITGDSELSAELGDAYPCRDVM